MNTHPYTWPAWRTLECLQKVQHAWDSDQPRRARETLTMLGYDFPAESATAQQARRAAIAALFKLKYRRSWPDGRTTAEALLQEWADAAHADVVGWLSGRGL